MTTINKDKPRVIVIGLDGATFTNLKPWMEQGLLPNLKFLIDNGASGKLESTMPRHSGPAWTSFMTGVNPGKHGIFGFFKPFKDKRYKKELNSSGDIKAKTVFEILSDNGMASGTINLPMTYPPFKINGFMIGCGLLSPGTDYQFTYPGDLFEKNGINKNGYILDVNPNNYPENEKERFFSELIKADELKRDVCFKLINKQECDLFVVIFGGTDRLQHFYWHCIDPSHEKYDKAEADKFLPLIIKYFQKLDSLIGEFIKICANKNTSLFIVSDHGFAPLEKYISLHTILEQNNLLNYKRESLLSINAELLSAFRGFLHRHSQIYRQIKNFIKPKYIRFRSKILKQNVDIRKIEKRLGGGDEKSWQRINWRKTMAYRGPCEDTLSLNLKGREPEGIIESNGKSVQITDKIINIFRNLRHPIQNRNLKLDIYRKSEIYSGPFLNAAPDLLFDIEDERYTLTTRKDEKQFFSVPKIYTGTHSKNGIIICYGNAFNKSSSINGAKIIDLAPTILYLLKTKIPQYMDGKVIKDAFDSKFINDNPISFNSTSYERNVASSVETAYTEQDSEKIKKHLADLGYV